MFRAKTLLVIGAGASFEVGLPVGHNLLASIAEMTHFQFEWNRLITGDHQILDALKIILDEGRDVTKLNDHLRASRQLGRSALQALSIDNVIDTLEDPKIELLGKLGISRAILQAEATSPQFRLDDVRKIDIKRFSDTWYSSLTKLLCEQVKRSQIESIFDNLEIINFNYDRCVEHYLQFSIAEYYGVSPEVVQRAMDKLIIHRPYGMVGRLPWRPGEGPGVDFGSGGAAQLARVATEIRTFTEQVEEGEQLDAIRAAVAGAERIVFLGFAFHRQNVDLIRADILDNAEILGTVHGISSADQSVIRSELASAFGYEGVAPLLRPTLADETCHEFFRNYWRSLTAASQED